MKSIVIVLLSACIAGSMAQDCSTKFKAFHECLEVGHKTSEEAEKAKFAALKPKIDACFTDNGCPAPAKEEKGKTGEHHGNKTGGNECGKAIHDAMKGKFEACIQKAIPGFVFPPKNATGGKGHFGGHKRFHHGSAALKTCAKKQAVMNCTRALFHSNKQTDAQKKAAFQARCDAKTKCLTALGADCQTKMQSFEKASCQCRQEEEQQVEQIRSSTAACQSEKKGTHPPRKQESCDRKDYCKLGYDQLVKDHPKGQH